MKIVHICTYDIGGAANAAIRLNDGLREMGHESSFLCLIQHKPHLAHTHQFPKNNVLQRGLGKVASLLKLSYNKHHAQQELLAQFKEEDFEYFSFIESDFDILSHPLVQEADLIHLHWINGFVDYPSFFEHINKPIVWTLHDMNPFQGGFHYKNDTQQQNEGFKTLDQEVFSDKLAALSQIKAGQLHVVCPSKWLYNCSLESEILGRFAHHHIPYGVNTSQFKALDANAAKKHFNIPEKLNILLFISQELDNPRKGFHLFKEAVESLDEQLDNWAIMTVGAGEVSLDFPNQYHLGLVNGVEEMVLAYNAADAFILPSIEDNLPNVMLESLACGTPLITFPVGGMVDVVQNQKNGIITQEVSADSLKTAIQSFMDTVQHFNRTQISQDCHSNYNLKNQAESYIDLYKTLL